MEPIGANHDRDAPRLPFGNREQAGRLLAEAVVAALPPHEARERLVLALPRGGVPVAVPVARAWRAPLDLLLVRKLGTPGHEELALGAIADAGGGSADAAGGVERAAPNEADDIVTVLNEDLIRQLRVPLDDLHDAERRERGELRRRSQALRAGRARLDPRGRSVVLVDDGVATGATIRAALRAVRAAGATHVHVATPVAPSDVTEMLTELADTVVVLATPDPFSAVGAHYRSFPQLSDEQVVRALRRFDDAASDAGASGAEASDVVPDDPAYGAEG